MRDESDFNGIRVAFELLPEASPRQSWRHLLARTALEVSIQCNFVVLKDGKDPKRLSLRYPITRIPPSCIPASLSRMASRGVEGMGTPGRLALKLRS